ncbi:MAG: hypothetical protein ABIP75_04855 [Pyrinomonadaceae bacterium]
MVTKRATTKTATKKKKGLTAKQEAERERLDRMLERNRDRQTSNLAVNGQALSEKQQETLKEIIRLQQEKLDEITALL